MCIHEMWTYSECGCQVEHQVPCTSSLRTRTQAPSLSPTMSKYNIHHQQVNSSPVRFPPSPSPTDSSSEIEPEDYYRTSAVTRRCSVKHEDKTFLEPICDDCLLKELGVDGRGDNHTSSFGHQFSGTTIAGSNQLAELEGCTPKHSHQRQVSAATIVESDVQIQIEDTITESCVSSEAAVSPVERHDTAFSGADADDEGSVIIPRGRPRSRTKELRRQAMDVSREDLRLRISSRWPSTVKKDMQTFKDMLQGRSPSPGKPEIASSNPPYPTITTDQEKAPPKTFLSRFTQAQNGHKSWAKNVVVDIKRALSKSGRQVRKAQASQDSDNILNENLDASTSAPAIYTLRAVANQSEIVISRPVPESDLEPNIDVTQSSASIASWQEHLSNDLKHRSTKRKSANRLSQLGMPSKALRRASSIPNWLIPSNPFSDSHRRLLSDSTTPSIPTTARSTSFLIPGRGQRLASIVSDSDFSHSHDQWTYRPGPLPNWLTQNINPSSPSIEDDEAAPSPTIPDTRPISDTYFHSHYPSTSIDSTAQSSPPRPISRLAMHPLTTPLRLSTPINRPTPPRTSSLRSPPLSAPMRLGSHISSSGGMKHSPTMGYACIWERRVCGACGESIPGEEGLVVKSCVCDGTVQTSDDGGSREGQTLRCRATAPVVGYVEVAKQEEECADGKAEEGCGGCQACIGRGR